MTDPSDADLAGLSLPQIIHWDSKQNEIECEYSDKGLNAVSFAQNRGSQPGPPEFCSQSNQHSQDKAQNMFLHHGGGYAEPQGTEIGESQGTHCVTATRSQPRAPMCVRAVRTSCVWRGSCTC